MLFLGLVVDVAFMTYVRSQGQARVDAAALAAGVALIHKSAITRQEEATQLAEKFSTENTLADDENPTNQLTPIHYDVSTDTTLELRDDWSPGFYGDNCNAVQVALSFPVAQFFAGIRSLVDGDEEDRTVMNVRAIAHLPCPGAVIPNTRQTIAPLALRMCQWSFPEQCDGNRRVFPVTGEVRLSTLFANMAAPNCGSATSEMVTADKTKVSLTTNPNCLADIREKYKSCTVAQCGDDNCTAIVPVMDCSDSIVKGFASLCFTGFDTTDPPQYMNVQLACGETADFSSGTGRCYGTSASNPILIR